MAVIRAPEFAKLLRSLIDKAAATGGQAAEVPKKIAIAVSGGIDSMALAHLCRKLRESDTEFKDTEFHAIIVDHAIREGSDEEAKAVENIMTKYGLKAHIRNLFWKDLENQKRLEKVAREYRYRQFAATCLENGIKHLITGHHANDQAETVLMRLVKESGSAGLAGMRPITGIPECERVHGADSIVLMRPFLGIMKERLQETLEVNNIKWFQDPTNKNPELTPRNAIRAMFSKTPKLPKALQPQSLIEFSNRMAARNEKANETVDWFLSRCYVRHVRETGVVECLIPVHLVTFPAPFLARVLARLAEVVSPLDRIDMVQMRRVVEGIIKATNPDKPLPNPTQKLTEDLKQDPMFRRILGDVNYTGGAMTENNIFWESVYCPPHHGRQAGVLIQCYRQPYIRSELRQRTDTPEIEITLEDPNRWILFDGRFWIRFTGSADDEFFKSLRDKRIRKIFITGTRKEVLYQIEAKDGFGKDLWKELKKRLKVDAPGKSRSVLPVVCEHRKQTVKKWQVPYIAVCFPTFDVGLKKAKGKWEWRPKKDLIINGKVVGNLPTNIATGKALQL
ncbi:hypothetical protein ABW19_dt0205293 [Dactylella cylindrospora]|nr:hypothetical protein ABW19_dt0205293 [Dactylella cylindrospora]